MIEGRSTRREALRILSSTMSAGGVAAALAGCTAGEMAAPKAREAVTLEYWSRFASPAAEVEDQRITEFIAQHAPTKVVKTITGNEYQQKLDAAFAGGSGPDAFSVGSITTYAGRGVTLVLDKHPGVQKELPDYFPFLADRCRYEKKLQGVPYIGDVRAVIYRTDVMREAGLDPTKLPDTWDQLRDAAKKMAKWDGDKLARGGFNVPKAGNTAYDIFLVMHDELGQPAFDSVDTPTKATFNGPNGRQALQFMVDLVNRDRVDSFEQPKAPPGQSALVAGLQAATWTSAGDINTARRAAPDQLKNLAVAFTPKFAKRLTFAGGTYLGAKKDSRDPDSVADFLVYLTQGKNAVEISTATSSVPSRKSAGSSDYVKDPLIKPFFDAIDHGRANILHPLGTQIRDAIAAEVEAAIKQTKGVQAALDDAQRASQELLSRKV